MKTPALAIICFSLLSGVGRGLEPPADLVERELAGLWRKIDARSENQEVRELFGFALEAAAVGWHPERVESALAQAAELQDGDRESNTFGNFRWYRNQPKPMDLNAVEFCLQPGILLWNLHREALTPAARATLAAMLRHGIAGMRSHDVGVAYTNIFLMKTWNCVAIGEAFTDADLAAAGRRMLDEWLDYTRVNGVHEYLSPTYSGVSCDSLALLHRFAQTSDVRAKAETALRLIYAQSAANWFAPSERLGGAHSRDYDYLTGHEWFLDRHLSAWGWLRLKPDVLNELNNLKRWVPASPLTPLPLPRFVWQRWGDTPGAYASTYVGQNFCLGSAGAAYGGEDKVLTIQFPGNPNTVMGNFVMDGRGDPYGQNTESVGGGHSKALHLTPFIVSVQDHADVLFAASFDPQQQVNGRSPRPTRQLSSNLVLPAEAEVWSGGRRVAPAAGESAQLAADQPIFVRVQDVVVAIRVLAATDCSGQPVAARYITDGASVHAARITWLQSVGAATGEAHVVFWMRAAEGLDASGFAHWRATFGGIPTAAGISRDKLQASVTREGQPLLAIDADLRTGERMVSPGPPGEAIITVNGRSLLELAGIKL